MCRIRWGGGARAGAGRLNGASAGGPAGAPQAVPCLTGSSSRRLPSLGLPAGRFDSKTSWRITTRSAGCVTMTCYDSATRINAFDDRQGLPAKGRPAAVLPAGPSTCHPRRGCRPAASNRPSIHHDRHRRYPPRSGPPPAPQFGAHPGELSSCTRSAIVGGREPSPRTPGSLHWCAERGFLRAGFRQPLALQLQLCDDDALRGVGRAAWRQQPASSAARRPLHSPRPAVFRLKCHTVTNPLLLVRPRFCRRHGPPLA